MAISNIVIKNGASTPVDTTFETHLGQSGQDAPATWYEKTAGYPAGFQPITLLVTRSKGAKPATKVKLQVKCPKLVVADGLQTIGHTVMADVTFTLPDTAAQLERDNILAYVTNVLANVQVKDAVKASKPAA